MPKFSRFTLIALVAVMAATLAQPAGAAATSDSRLAATRRQRAAAAAKLNALKASDSELERAVKVLNEQVRAQSAAAQAARQSLAVIEDQLRQTEARIAVTTKEMSRLHKQLVERALAAYMQPQGEGATPFKARNFNEASRGQALLAQMAARDQDVLDRLRETRLELQDQQAEAARQRKVAEERRGAVEQKLAKLTSDKSALAAKARALDARIREFQGEVDALAKQESAIAALIRQRAAAARSSRGSDPGADGRVSGAGLVWPLRGPVTSEYGSRWGRMHSGIDISGGTGTPIRAAKAGVVIFAGQQSGYGNVVVIDHGGGFTTLYAHQSRLATSDGQSVSQGQVIGYVGSTGRSTGPHLHFETRVNGGAQNPRRYLP